MAQQTAVEFYRKEFISLLSSETKYKSEAEIFEQAKQMEKQQMKDVYMEHVLRPFVFNFEEYYKETYGK